MKKIISERRRVGRGSVGEKNDFYRNYRRFHLLRSGRTAFGFGYRAYRTALQGDFFKKIQQKAFYVIGNYDPQSEITKYDIVNRFGLPGHQIGTIPYNRRFADALTEGKVIPFLLRNYDCGKENANYDFMSAVKETVCLYEQAKEA